MKNHVSILLLTLLSWSCNEVNDLQPVEPGTVPQATIEIVKTEFPDAKELVFKSLLNDKIWEVKFSTTSQKYTSLVDDTQMWQTFRELPDSLPAALPDALEKTPFSGGSFSENAEDVAFYKEPRRLNGAIYNYKGTGYYFEWLRYPGESGDANFQLYKYQLNLFKQNDLPDVIQKYIAARPELKFSTAQVLVMPDYKKQFLVALEYQKGENTRLGKLLFDEAGNLKWIDREFNRPDVYSDESNVPLLPGKIQQYLENSTELVDFYHHTIPLEQWRGEYDGVSSYYIKLYHRDYAESCEMYFDQDQNLIFKRYFVSFP